MPNIKSAKKRVRVTAAKTLAKKAATSELRTELKKAAAALEGNQAVRVAVKKLDQAAAKGIVHKNAAARKKAQLAKKLNAANA